MYLESIFLMVILIFWKLQLLKGYNADHFRQTFHVSKKTIVNLVLLSGIILFMAQPVSHALCYIILLVITPVYFFKSFLFAKNDNKQPRQYLDGDDDVTRRHLILEGFNFAIFWLYGMSIFAAIYKGFVSDVFDRLTEIDELMIFAVYSTVMTLYLIYRSAKKFSPDGFWKNVGFTKGVSKFKCVVVPVILGLLFACSSAYVILGRDFHPSTPLSESLATAQSHVTILFFLMLALMVAPLSEEIVFWGYFFHIFAKVRSERFAVYSIAFTFAFLHVGQYWGDWMAIVMVGLMGFTLTILRSWTKTTLSSVITHYIYNLGVTIIPVIVLVMQNPSYLEYQTRFHLLDNQQKIELLTDAIEKQPELSEAYNDLAWIYAEDNFDLEEALALVNKALHMSPENVAYLDTKAEVLGKMGKTSEALSIRQKIVDMTYSEDILQTQEEKISELKLLIDQ